MQTADVLIVGQGLAGSILSYQLLQEHKSVAVIDNGSGKTASRQATGLINPITGRRFVKSWMTNELLPFAQKFYSTVEKDLELHFLTETKVAKLMQNLEQVNDFNSRLQEDAYTPFLREGIKKIATPIVQENGCGIIQPALQIDINTFQDGLLALIKEHCIFQSAIFDHNKLEIHDDGFTYQDIKARKIIFAEGYLLRDNKYFNYLPIRFAKGEALHIEAKDLKLTCVLNGKVNFTPLPNDTYYVGATYDWNDDKQQPTAAKKAYIEEGIKATTDVAYSILEHKVGIRPTVVDRRPLLGEHPKHKGMYVFNGMGTKGLSLAPYFARQLIQHIFEGSPLNPEADIKRVP